ncbi:hypothetical protein VTL71DRAFT_12415 [Oculimacula yallundae]|uniref:DUF1772-domain-containing protein n=1 Tax=Oculimacula yallundae TaxID=86028 RepID=A0ABR4CMI9_9HELO
MKIFSDPTFLKAFAAFNTIWLAALAGAAQGMYTFSIPIVRNNTSSFNMLRQFHQLITLGAKYMQGSSRVQGILLATLSYLLYIHPDPEIAARWKYFAAALVIGVQVAWYEVVFIFPTNDRLVDMEGELKRMDGEERGERELEMRGEILVLLDSWRKWHIGRIVVPFISASLILIGLMF